MEGSFEDGHWGIGHLVGLAVAGQMVLLGIATGLPGVSPIRSCRYGDPCGPDDLISTSLSAVAIVHSCELGPDFISTNLQVSVCSALWHPCYSSKSAWLNNAYPQSHSQLSPIVCLKLHD